MEEHISSHGVEERLLHRKELGKRWSCSGETLKRYEKRGLLKPIKLAPRMLRYRLSDVIALEEAGRMDRMETCSD